MGGTEDRKQVRRLKQSKPEIATVNTKGQSLGMAF